MSGVRRVRAPVQWDRRMLWSSGERHNQTVEPVMLAVEVSALRSHPTVVSGPRVRAPAQWDRRMMRSSGEGDIQEIQKCIAEPPPCLTWLARHQACLNKRHQVGRDGRTPQGRMAGKGSGAAVAEFCEHAIFKSSRTGHASVPMVWLRTQETHVGTPEGVFGAWSFKRGDMRIGGRTTRGWPSGALRTHAAEARTSAFASLPNAIRPKSFHNGRMHRNIVRSFYNRKRDVAPHG